ncbi:hypothetical protein Ae706Ps2_3138 [Pseudonocardia sp. Ae706_Ps2]|nr:hypothetical protein Ae706Ps2_3138 [Pseudonocardia sp. Ae706_Ps2]
MWINVRSRGAVQARCAGGTHRPGRRRPWWAGDGSSSRAVRSG